MILAELSLFRVAFGEGIRDGVCQLLTLAENTKLPSLHLLAKIYYIGRQLMTPSTVDVLNIHLLTFTPYFSGAAECQHWRQLVPAIII